MRTQNTAEDEPDRREFDSTDTRHASAEARHEAETKIGKTFDSVEDLMRDLSDD